MRSRTIRAAGRCPMPPALSHTADRSPQHRTSQASAAPQGNPRSTAPRLPPIPPCVPSSPPPLPIVICKPGIVEDALLSLWSCHGAKVMTPGKLGIELHHTAQSCCVRYWLIEHEAQFELEGLE